MGRLVAGAMKTETVCFSEALVSTQISQAVRSSNHFHLQSELIGRYVTFLTNGERFIQFMAISV